MISDISSNSSGKNIRADIVLSQVDCAMLPAQSLCIAFRLFWRAWWSERQRLLLFLASSLPTSEKLQTAQADVFWAPHISRFICLLPKSGKIPLPG